MQISERQVPLPTGVDFHLTLCQLPGEALIRAAASESDTAVDEGEDQSYEYAEMI